MSLGILLLRVVVGLTFAAHGAQKMFGWFGGAGQPGTTVFFQKLGFRAPGLMAFTAALAELAGILFALGLLTPLAALAIAVVMLNAIGTVHWRKGFFVTEGGYEFNIVLLTVGIAVVATGPGRWSLDHAIGWDGDITGAWWAAGVLLAALAVSTATLRLFHAKDAGGPQEAPA